MGPADSFPKRTARRPPSAAAAAGRCRSRFRGSVGPEHPPASVQPEVAAETGGRIRESQGLLGHFCWRDGERAAAQRPREPGRAGPATATAWLRAGRRAEKRGVNDSFERLWAPASPRLGRRQTKVMAPCHGADAPSTGRIPDRASDEGRVGPGQGR